MPARYPRDIVPTQAVAQYLSADVPTASPADTAGALRRSL
jgi:hypothetical protein